MVSPALTTSWAPRAYHRRVNVLDETRAAPRRLPLGILIVAGLRIIDAIALAVAGLRALGVTFSGFPLAGLPLLGADPAPTRVLSLVLAVVSIIGVVGLLQRRRWGWTVTVLLVGIELALHLVRFLQSGEDSLGLGILVVTALYLNQRSVRGLSR